MRNKVEQKDLRIPANVKQSKGMEEDLNENHIANKVLQGTKNGAAINLINEPPNQYKMTDMVVAIVKMKLVSLTLKVVRKCL